MKTGLEMLAKAFLLGLVILLLTGCVPTKGLVRKTSYYRCDACKFYYTGEHYIKDEAVFYPHLRDPLIEGIDAVCPMCYRNLTYLSQRYFKKVP